jgi:DNA-binding CsgD family transcriptional regulator
MVTSTCGRAPGEAFPPTGLLNTLFLLGWCVADEAHLPLLPEALVQGLNVAYAQLRISDMSGNVVHDYAYPQDSTPVMHLATHAEPHSGELSRLLGEKYTLLIRISSGPQALTQEQSAAFDTAGDMIHAALNVLFIKQRDRAQLGAPYTQFSDREWAVCERLYGPEGEKAIAEAMDASRHTVHCHVKNIYRKLKLQSRLEVIHHLRQARGASRREAMHASPFGLEQNQEKEESESHDVRVMA